MFRGKSHAVAGLAAAAVAAALAAPAAPAAATATTTSGDVAGTGKPPTAVTKTIAKPIVSDKGNVGGFPFKRGPHKGPKAR